MSDASASPSLEERRLALDERKWADELALRKAEAAAKARDSTWFAKLSSPLVVTVFAGIATVVGSVSATLFQNSHSLLLEQKKEQHELILKMVTGTGEMQARKNLEFLADVGLVDEETATKIRNAKTTPVIPAANRAASTSIPPAPEELRKLMSDDAMQAILSFEISSKSEYEKSHSHPYWAHGASGIIIGIDYEIGYATPEQFEVDWKSHLPQADFEALNAAVGVRGPAAEPLAKSLSSVTISWENAIAVFYGSTLPKWSAILDRSLPNARDLPPESYGALVSLIINRGAGFERQGDAYVEMRKIRELMALKQFSEIPAQLRSMKRVYANRQGLALRREKEAALFEKGFSHVSPSH
jgi:hypothetical protein